MIDRRGVRATVGSLVADLVSALDRAWFEANPGQRFRERPPVEGEFDMPKPDDDAVDVPMNRAAVAVLVEQIAPGVRVRMPLFLGDCRADALARRTPEMIAAIERFRREREV